VLENKNTVATTGINACGLNALASRGKQEQKKNSTADKAVV